MMKSSQSESINDKQVLEPEDDNNDKMPKSRPWQMDWKRPRWVQPRPSENISEKEKIEETRVIGVSSAQVRIEEIAHLGVLDKDLHPSDSVVLTVTLLQSIRNKQKSESQSPVADKLKLQLINYYQETSEILIQRVYQWPGSALGQERRLWKIKDRGLAGACLCRSPLKTNRELDALDLLQSMALGAPLPLSTTIAAEPPPSATPASAPSSTTTSNGDHAELILACLTLDGRIHIYNPLTTLLDGTFDSNDENKPGDISWAMAAFLMGPAVLEQVQNSMQPFSNPLYTINLNRNFFQPIHKKKDFHVQDGKVPLWDPMVWDSTVDAATLQYQTEDNVPTICESAWEFVVVAGHGKRQVRALHSSSPQEDTSRVQRDWWQESSNDEPPPSESSTVSPPPPFSVVEGGFLIFVSLHHKAEARILFLPFRPTSVAPVLWQGMAFLLVTGSPGVAVAIYLDASHPISMPRLARFQVLPIVFPLSDEECTPATTHLVASTPFTTPPAIVAVSRDAKKEGSQKSYITLAQRTLHAFRYVPRKEFPLFAEYHGNREIPRKTDGGKTSKNGILVIDTMHHSGHMARLTNSSCEEEDNTGDSPVWCHVSQGWCLVGASNRVDFVCWEGATASRGASVCEVAQGAEHYSRGRICSVLPVDLFKEKSRSSKLGQTTRSFASIGMGLPFTAPYQMPAGIEDLGGSEHSLAEGSSDGHLQGHGFDEIVIEALESISNINYRDDANVLSPSRKKRNSLGYTSQQKSMRLLRQCSSWMQLDDSEAIQRTLGGQVPVLSFHAESGSGTHCDLTLRKVVVKNGVASPFQQVLAWLSDREDYFTAASVALDLLQDAESLRHLWRDVERIDEEDERTKLDGLLDGIIPLQVEGLEPENNGGTSTLTQLADMAVGCLTKGGFVMSSTLEFFVERDLNYDPARACLMLVATAAQAVSGDREVVASVMGSGYQEITSEHHEDDILWPVRCLLQIGVSRHYLPTALVLLNVTIPDELRRKRRGDASAPNLPSLDLCKSIVSLILASSPESPELLLGLVDEQSRNRFWQSINYDTQLALSLIAIDGTCPLLRQQEVRSWARENLHQCLEEEVSSTNVKIPTDWQKDLCVACLENAGCNWETLIAGDDDEQEDIVDDDDGIQRHKDEMQRAQNALRASPGSGGLDYDLFIPALLLLEHRGVQWHENVSVSTQSILEAACFLAGRHGENEAMFPFDSSAVMRQCALAGNVGAGASLVGGRNGLVLKCCDILIDSVGASMDEAEAYLIQNRLSLNFRSSMQDVSDSDDSFHLTDGHRHLLWLLEEYVLRIRTYGEFGTTKTRGSVDPVFAARCFFRAWYALHSSDPKPSTTWLTSWLRECLAMEGDTVSPKRLACAALTRALVWSSDETGDPAAPDQVLATLLQFENQFLVQLAQACCGLVPTIPLKYAEELLLKMDSSSDSLMMDRNLAV